ncbi:MAG: hypothetical protein AB1352_04830 [Patescibacteria group bacterium]
MPTIKTISSLELRKRFGELTDEVLYSNVWLKVTKNRKKAFLMKPWEEGAHYLHKSISSEIEAAKKRNMEEFLKKLDRLRKQAAKKSKLINGMSWSEFIQYDRHHH